jgi:hypothetical protein
VQFDYLVGFVLEGPAHLAPHLKQVSVGERCLRLVRCPRLSFLLLAACRRVSIAAELAVGTNIIALHLDLNGRKYHLETVNRALVVAENGHLAGNCHFLR